MIPLKQNNLGWRESLAPSLMTRILVPTDLTDDSRIAIWYAIGLARRARAKLTLLHVRIIRRQLGRPPARTITLSLNWMVEECWRKAKKRSWRSARCEIGLELCTQLPRTAS